MEMELEEYEEDFAPYIDGKIAACKMKGCDNSNALGAGAAAQIATLDMVNEIVTIKSNPVIKFQCLRCGAKQTIDAAPAVQQYLSDNSKPAVDFHSL